MTGDRRAIANSVVALREMHSLLLQAQQIGWELDVGVDIDDNSPRVLHEIDHNLPSPTEYSRQGTIDSDLHSAVARIASQLRGLESIKGDENG